MNRTLITTAKIVFAVLALIGLALQLFIIPANVTGLASAYAEVASIAPVIIGWGAFVIACGQAALVVTWRLLDLVRDDSIFTTDAFTWVRALTWCPAAIGLSTLAMFVVLNAAHVTPPALMLSMLAAIGASAAATLILAVLFALLRQSATMRYDLAEVI